jgi:hypothetical protein
MSSFPGSPFLHKGAIVIIDTSSSTPKVVSFQYNPDLLTRTLTPKTSRAQTGGSDTFRLEGPPDEDIELNIELDATDDLEHPAQSLTTVADGINPQLAAIETVLYPKASQIIANAVLANMGSIEIVPPQAPLTLFVLGPNRVLPVKLTRYRVSEEAYDTELNPIRAKVTLSLRVLSYADLQQSQIGYAIYQASHLGKEKMAQQSSSVSSGGSIGATI